MAARTTNTLQILTKQASRRDWFGQPRGMAVVCAVEMWEVFSMQGMRTLLVYYLTTQLLFSQARASSIYGTYIAFVFLTPLLGGLLADHWLGRRRSVLIGGLLMALGQFLMTSPGLLFVALTVLAVGNGFYKPCLASQIQDLYSPEDPRRDSAYSIFYAGKNLGAVLAPLGCGTVGELFGWRWGFMVAGAGMLVGLGFFLFGLRYLPREIPTLQRKKIPSEPGHLRLTSARQFAQLAAVIIGVVVFILAYEQLGNTFAIWVESGVDRSIGAVTIPMTWFQSLNPLLVFLLTPVLILLWKRLGNRDQEPGAVAKMASGALILCAGYLLLAAVVAFASARQQSVGVLWIIPFMVLYTIAELHVLPIGLGLYRRLAPQRFAASVVAGWFVTIFAGNFAAGQIGRLWTLTSPAQFFLILALFAGASGLLLLWARVDVVSTREQQSV
jgi:POT family proton-dependent oligopeptide transporter